MDPRRLLNLGGFDMSEVDLRATRGGCRAMLQPAVNNRFRICVDAAPLSGAARGNRLRFLVAHEIGHSFFYDREGDTPRRMLPVGSAAEEGFCNEFACALLLPPRAVAACVAAPEAVFTLATRFAVSTEVAARAFAALHPTRPVVVLAYWTRARELAIQWAGSASDWPAPQLLTEALGRGIAAGGAAFEAFGLRCAVDHRRRQVVAVA